MSKSKGAGTEADPWTLTTPPGKSEYQVWRDEKADPPALVVQVKSTQLRYSLRCIEDLHGWLVEQGDWVLLGNKDEGKPAAEGTIEAFGRAADNPVGGWYGLKKGLRAGSPTTSRPCSKSSAWSSSSTRRATTERAPSSVRDSPQQLSDQSSSNS